MPVVPSPAGNGIDPETGFADAVHVIPVVRGSAVQIRAAAESIDRMEGEAVGRKTIPHELSEDRIMFVEIVAGARIEIPVDTGELARWIQRRRNTSADIE